MSGLALTSENYGTSLNLLGKRFGSETLIISSHMMALNKLPSITSSFYIEQVRGIFVILWKTISGHYQVGTLRLLVAAPCQLIWS